MVLRKAKAMNYKDLIAKRADREAKEQDNTKGHRERGRKYKSRYRSRYARTKGQDGAHGPNTA